MAVSICSFIWRSYCNKSPYSGQSGLAKHPFVAQRRRMTFPSLPRWFTFLTGVAAAVAFLFISGDAEEPNRLPDARQLSVTAHRLAVPAGNVDIPTALSLHLTDAWELTSANSEFGGLSAMYASGRALTFVADRGALIRLGSNPASESWRGIVSPLPFGCGDMNDKHLRDTESLAFDPKMGTLWIGFEHRNGICRIASENNEGTLFNAPKAMSHWWKAGGPEAMVRLKGGGFLIFQETPRDHAPDNDVLYFDRDPAEPSAKVTLMRYRAPTGFSPVDAAQLPDGRLLVLNRQFALPFNFTNRLSILTLPKIKPGALLTGPIIARIDGGGIADNYEALAIDSDGQDLSIWLASDSNFFSIQRTLLLRFAWPGAARLEPRVHTG